MPSITIQGDKFEIEAISPRAKKVLKDLIEAHDTFAFKGSMNPDDWQEIEENFETAVKAYSRFVNSLESER